MSLKQPVQYPVKYYSHLDVGAPQLANIDGNIKTILKACLVTGIGDKEGAGWTSLFEDDFRIVLRRPLRTGNPPDIKIENGVINGAASHRIVSQDNPTGLNDATELAAVNLLARDSKHGVQWHLIAGDSGFMLCYQMGDNLYNEPRNSILFCGSTQKIQAADADFFITSQDEMVKSNGYSDPGYYLQSFMSAQMLLKNMRTNITDTKKNILSIDVVERYFNDDYFAQPIIVGHKYILPFFCSITARFDADETQIVEMDSRPMLRYVNKSRDVAGTRSYYIPLDYWEL